MQNGGHSRSNPYQTVQDYLSNVGKFKIIESTLRGEQMPLPELLSILVADRWTEGEQFANAYFTTEKKIEMYVPCVDQPPIPTCAHGHASTASSS